MTRLLALAAVLWLVTASAFAQVADLRRLPRDGFVEFQFFAPDPLPPTPKLVVVLHGCRQDGALYAVKSGWLSLARDNGFVLLVPTFRGNPDQCWEWYNADNIGRYGRGMPAVIEGAVNRLRRHLDRPDGGNYVTGLSSGAAIALSVLASYPETFAGGAVFSGLALGAAIMPDDRYTFTCNRPPPGRVCNDRGGNCCCLDDVGTFSFVPNLRQACAAMEHPIEASPQDWLSAARRALPEGKPVRPLLVVQGTSDVIVDCANAGQIATQWAALAGVSPPTVSCQTGGAAVSGPVELRLVSGLDHFQPVMPGCGEHDPDKFFLNAPICGARAAWEFFGR